MPEPGTLIEGKYEILGKIREGGMGSIYKVRHKLLDEIRVIKVVRPEMVADEELKRRFVEEAKTATRLKHPNIGTIHDFALDEDGTAYLVMEFIEGVSLNELKATQGPPGLALSLETAHQTLLALGYLHRKNLVHRDIAPDNLMLTHDDEGRPQIKLIDLGIAKAVDREQHLTSTGVFLGKLKYASPELFGALPPGEKLDGRSDLYSLGVVLYELLTGVRPIGGEAPAELLRGHLFLAPLPFEKSDPLQRVPPEVRAVVLRALEKKREDRFATAEEFDREIVALRGNFARPTDLEATLAILTSVQRGSRESSAVTVTPSAQDRLDRQFMAQATPHPSRPPLARTETAHLEPTAIDPGAAAKGTGPRPSVPAARPRKRQNAVWIAAACAVIAAGGAIFLANRRGAREVARPSNPSASPVAAVIAPPEPTRSEPTAAPTAAATEPPSPQPAPSPPAAETADARRAAEHARTQAARARSGAEQARAVELASEEFRRGAAKQREAQGLFERKNYPAAQPAFGLAAQLFDAAQMRAETAQRETRRPSPIPVAAQLVPPLPTARSEPTHSPAVAAEPPRPPTAAPAELVRTAPNDQDRIRETIRRYEKAQSTLDADLYASVFPSVDREKIRANFQSLSSQTLEFDVQKIEIAPGGLSAVVRGYEKRSAMPRAGSEQRFSGDRVIHLEKKADGWVITRLGT